MLVVWFVASAVQELLAAALVRVFAMVNTAEQVGQVVSALHTPTAVGFEAVGTLVVTVWVGERIEQKASVVGRISVIQAFSMVPTDCNQGLKV